LEHVSHIVFGCVGFTNFKILSIATVAINKLPHNIETFKNPLIGVRILA